MKKWVCVISVVILAACNNSGTLENRADSIERKVDSLGKRVWDSGKKEVLELKEKIREGFNQKDSVRK